MTSFHTAILAVLLALFLNTPTPNGVFAHAAPPESELPADIRLLPNDTMVFCRFRLDTLWSTEAFKKWRADKKDRAGSWERFEVAFRNNYGVSPESVTTLTAACQHKREEDVFVMVKTHAPYDRAAVIKAVIPDAKEGKHHAKSLWTSAVRPERAIHFHNDTLFVIAPPDILKHNLESATGAADKGPLGPALRQSSGPHHIVGGIHHEGASEPGGPKGPVLEPPKGIGILLLPRAAPIPDLVSMTAVVSYTGKVASGHTSLTFPDEATAKKSVEVVTGRVRHLHLIPLALAIRFTQGSDEELKPAVKLLDRTSKSLEIPSIVQKGKTVEVVVSVDIGEAEQVSALRVLSGVFAK